MQVGSSDAVMATTSSVETHQLLGIKALAHAAVYGIDTKWASVAWTACLPRLGPTASKDW